MRRLALLLALWVSPAEAGLFGPRLDPLRHNQQAFDAGRYREVIADLSPDKMQKYRGHDLRHAMILLGESHARLGRREEALGIYQLGVKLFPSDTLLLTYLAQLQHAAGLEEQAKPLYEKILTMHPENALAHQGLAEIDRALGFLDRSAEHYEKALEDLGFLAKVWRDYAEVLYEQRDYLTAEPAIRKALALSPDVDSYIDLALIRRAQGATEEAIEILQKLEDAGTRVDLRLTLALWQLEASRYDDARRSVEALLKADGQLPLARYIRARLELKAGRKEAAIKDLEVAAAGKDTPFLSKTCAKLLEKLRTK